MRAWNLYINMNMKKTTIVNMVIAWLFIVILSYIVIIQHKVNANEEILALQQRNMELEARNAELDKLIQDEKDWWWVDEDARDECVKSCQTSFTDSQNKRSIKADWYRAEKANNNDEIEKNKKKLGLLLSR